MKFFFLLLTLTIYIAPKVAVSQVVKYSNDFLEIGGFSRTESLAGSDLASVSGCESVFGNPSRLFSDGCGADFAAMHNNYFQSMASFDILAAAVNADSLTALGISLSRFAVDDIQNTIGLFDEDGNMDYSRISYFSTSDYTLYIALSRKIRGLPFLSLGGNVKLIYRKQGPFAKAYGFGFDLAATCNFGKLAASAVLRDASTTFDFWSVDKSQFDSTFLFTGNSVPENSLEQRAPSLDLGFSYYIDIWRFRALAAFALSSYFENRSLLIHSRRLSLDPKFGLELSYQKLAFLRFGISDFQKAGNMLISKKFTSRPSFGAGISFMRFRFDYAFYATNSISLNSNVFTLGVKLGRL